MAFFFLSNPGVSAKTLKISSPGKTIQGIFQSDKTGHLSYSVKKHGRTILLPSPIGILVDSIDLGDRVILGKAKYHFVEEQYHTIGVHSNAINNYTEALIPVEGGSSKIAWTLEVRVFNDGVAYRYTVPGKDSRTINGESSAWKLPTGSKMWYQSNIKRDYEAPFRFANPDTITSKMILMTTATFQLAGGLGYVRITEANLINYSDMALEVSQRAIFKALFHNSLNGWGTTGQIQSPWRILLSVDNLNALVNSDIIQNLCPPPAPELSNASWIIPGRSTWHWMVTGRPKLEDQKQWVDWTNQVGFEYYIIDDGWIRWKKDSLDQWACMKEVVDYAKSQGVKIWAWTHSKELVTTEQRADYFAKAKAVGIVGLKIDFMKPADPFWVNWYDDCLRDAAKAELMINFHGALKPTGRERTWPNELTREGIRGREAAKQPAFHDISLIFTRFTQGHADYTPTDFRPEKLNGSTWAHELAMGVLFTSPLFCFSGRPEDYIASEAASFLKNLPVVWDETIVLPVSEIGEIAVMARRKDKDWYIGVLNASERSNLSISLDFLGDGAYEMESFQDVAGNNVAWKRTLSTENSKEMVSVFLSKDGGFVARLSPKK